MPQPRLSSWRASPGQPRRSRYRRCSTRAGAEQPVDVALVTGLLRAIGVEASEPVVEALARPGGADGRSQLEEAA